MSRPGWLFPLQPYTVHVNTIHVPTVESTLLHAFLTKGDQYNRVAPIVFQDHVAATIRYLELGSHILPDHRLSHFISPDTVTGFIPSILVGASGNVPWTIASTEHIWMPATIRDHLNSPAVQFKALIAVYLRVNGSLAMLKRSKAQTKEETRLLNTKVDEHIQRHFALAQLLDGMDFPSDFVIKAAGIDLTQHGRGGKTDFKDDRDRATVQRRTIKVEPTPLEVIGNRRHAYLGDKTVLQVHGAHLAEFALSTDDALETIALAIRTNQSDASLEWNFAPLDSPGKCRAFPHYYPIPMESAAQCRAHSWYLACLVILNKSWTEVVAPTTVPAGEERKIHGPVAVERPLSAFVGGGLFSACDPPSLNKEFLHSLAVRHAFHRVAGSFLALFAEVVHTKKIADADWRMDLESRPSALERHFPADTTCFHWGDLPSLEPVLSQVGLTGVQSGKGKKDMVRVLMKSLPVCCGARDMAKCFLNACKGRNGETFWRIVRTMFFCSLAGLYPGSVHRMDFLGMMRLYRMIFIDRKLFLAALGREIKDNRKRPKGEKENKTGALVVTVFREYFIYLTSRDSEWVQLVDHYIKWEQFVAATLHSADEMRAKINLATAPQGNEFVHAINALDEVAVDLDVYRYRKATYVNTVLNKLDTIHDCINESREIELRDIRVMQGLLNRILDEEILEEEDLEPLYETVHIKRLFQGDPYDFYEKCPGLPGRRDSEFHHALANALAESELRHEAMSYALDPQVKRNIWNFLLRTKPRDRLKIEYLLDPRLGGVAPQAIQMLYKTKTVYDTRSSPKSIKTYVSNLFIRDMRIFSWYFHLVARLEQFRLEPLDAETTEQQARAFRRNRYHLLPHEPLPPDAWIVRVCLCCGRVPTFADVGLYGNFRVAFDPVAKTLICDKKVSRVARAKARADSAKRKSNRAQAEGAFEEEEEPEPEPEPEEEEDDDDDVLGADGDEDDDAEGVFGDDDDDDAEGAFGDEEGGGGERATAKKKKKKKKVEPESKKRARAERRESNTVPCTNQPVISVNLYGAALVHGKSRMMFCPECARFHTYSQSGWGRGGYRCKICRVKETPPKKLERCSFCGNAERGSSLKMVDLLVPDKDPSCPDVVDVDTGLVTKFHDPLTDPMRCYQTVWLCQADANSVGLFAKHHTKRYYLNMSKEELWKIISPANTERRIEQIKKRE